MRMLATMLALGTIALLAGCGGGGGGGGGGSEVSPFAGAYAGTYTVSRHGTMSFGFDPPANGTASATVSNSGSLRVDYGNSYVLTAQLASDGSASSGSMAFVSPSGAQSIPALVAWGGAGNSRNVSASVAFDAPTGSATFSALITK